MKYALGNMLNGAGGLNADQLALDLQFAADKTLTARRGPTPVLTRGTSATLVNSAGLIEYAPENLLLQSENFGTTWSSVNLNQTGTPPYLNVATAPDGATTSDKLIATTSNTTHQFRQDVTLVSGTSYTISVYFKAAETNFATISVVGVANGSADWVAYFNISTSSPAAGQFNGFASTSLVDVGNGWRRCSVTFTATASGSLNTRFGGATSANLNSNFYAGDGTSGFLVWGAQLEVGPLKSYNPTTTAAFYGPRFDHDPANPTICRGLLIEEGRTNLLVQSENFGTTWNASQLNVTGTPPYLNVATAPDGTTTADKFIANSTATTHTFRQDVSVTNGTTYTVSCFFKAAEVSTAGFAIGSGVTGTHLVGFDLSNGTRFGTLFGFSAATITAFPNGWYRCAATFAATSTGTSSIRIAGVLNSGGNPPLDFYAGDGTSGFLVWGAQLEAGSFATSYIPTTTSALARAADTCSISNITSFYAGLGTLFAGSVSNGASSQSGICGFNTSNTNQIMINRLATVVRGQTAGATPTAVLPSSTIQPTTFAKTAFAFNTNDASFATNGVLSGTTTSLALPSVSAFQIGGNGGQVLQSGTITEIKYFRKRLPNAKLQALTV